MQGDGNDRLPSTKKLSNIEPHTYYGDKKKKIVSFKFLVRENGGIIETSNNPQIMIGRRGSMNHVDVDLSDFEGRELGVSRSHCMLEVADDRVLLRDLESINGTFLNGQQLTPMRGYEVDHGDEIKLGRLHLLVFFIGADFEVML